MTDIHKVLNEHITRHHSTYICNYLPVIPTQQPSKFLRWEKH